MKKGTKVKVTDWMHEFDTDSETAKHFELVNWQPWESEDVLPKNDQTIYVVIGSRSEIRPFTKETMVKLAITDENGRQFIIASEGVEELTGDK